MGAGFSDLTYFAIEISELLAFAVIVFQNKSYISNFEADNKTPVSE